MSDPFAQQPGKNAPSPFALQMLDPKFQGLSYDEQQRSRLSLFISKAQGSPSWEAASDDQRLQALGAVKTMYPPAFSDPKYDSLRQVLDDPGTAPFARFVYSTGAQMGITGIVSRGVVNASRAIEQTVSGAASEVDRFFGGNPDVARQTGAFRPGYGVDYGALLQRAMGGDKDGVKLAQYLQEKYEKPLNPRIPLIGGQTPTQLLGSTLGFGTDLLTTGGLAPVAEGAATLGAKAASPIAEAGIKAAVTGYKGVIRGAIAGVANAAQGAKAPVEGAVDFTHGIAQTAQSIGVLWGEWAAQDFALGMLGRSITTPLSEVGKGFLQSVFGKGTKALPKAREFDQVAGGTLTQKAESLQQRFESGNLAPESRSQLGPIAQDWSKSLEDTLGYSRDDPMAILKNPVAAWRIRNQLMMEGKNTPLGIASVPDNAEGAPTTWRLRENLAKEGEVLGEHLSFLEGEMVTHGRWNDAVPTAQEGYDKWNGRYEETGGHEALRQMQSRLLRKEALQDAFSHDLQIKSTLDTVRGNMDRLAPEGSAKLPSEGAMLTPGEVSRLEGLGMKAAKMSVALDPSGMADIAKSGSLVPSDAPTRFQTVSGGDYNAAILYAKGAPEPIWQEALKRGEEYAKNTPESNAQELAMWYLRDTGYDAIEHADGSVTALYPRQQIKHVSDLVNKSSREYVSPELPEPKMELTDAQKEDIRKWNADHGVKGEGAPETYSAPSMLGSEGDKLSWLLEAANREANTRITRLPDGTYQLHMYGAEPVQGDLASITDAFLTRATTSSHLKASLKADGMSLTREGGNYNILDREGKVLGSGETMQLAMQNARYRPRLLDGRFGPANVEVLPEGSRFEYSPQGIRGTLSDVYRYVNQFMDVAEEEGKRSHLMTDSGGVALGHDGAYTVEIPLWGIREKFASAAEARDYLNGRYKEYDNAARLANERGFTFSYEPKRGYVLTGASGTYTVRTMDEVGKVLSQVPDPRWAPGGQYDAGVTMKDSADATRLPVDTMPSYVPPGLPTKTFADRGPVGKALSFAKSAFSDLFLPLRASLDRAARVYGLKDMKLSKVQDAAKTMANMNYLDDQRAFATVRSYRLSRNDLIVTRHIMEALDEGERNQVFEDFGLKEGDPKRPAIINLAERMRKLYDTVHQRTGQDPDIKLKAYAPKHMEFKAREPEQYQDMELGGPEGMIRLVERTNGGRVPDGMRLAALNERVADVDGAIKQEDALSQFIYYSHMANRWAYLSEPLKEFKQRISQADVPEHIRALGDNFIDHILNYNRSVVDKVLQPARGAMSTVQGLIGTGLYGLKPGTALHIEQNAYAVGSGYLGSEAMNQGFKASRTGGTAHLEELYRRGVFTGRSSILYSTGDVVRGTNWFSSMLGKLGHASAFFVQNGHIQAKAAVYDGASWLFDKSAKAWFDRGQKGSWQDVMRKARGYHLDQDALAQVERLIGQGDYAGARHAYAQNMTDQITYMWRPEDQGALMGGATISRLYGQLMVLPTNYLSSLTRLASRGSFADRVGNLAAYAKNTAALYAANRAAGLSGANLLPWNIVTLRGGPLWQDIIQLSTQRPDKKGLAAALKALGTLPPVAEVRQAATVIKQLQEDKPWGAFLTLTGFSVRPDLRASKR